jgi:hypothetical protein
MMLKALLALFASLAIASHGAAQAQLVRRNDGEVA